MESIAPYADIPITVSLSSLTGLKYRDYSCIECGQPIIERSSERIFRFSSDMPEEAHIGADGTIPTTCSRCSQKYSIIITTRESEGSLSNMPLYMQPQALFISVEPVKKLRDTHCMECGHAFYSISDRVSMLVDNVVPFEMLDPTKLGPMEARCKFHHCKQRWSVMA